MRHHHRQNVHIEEEHGGSVQVDVLIFDSRPLPTHAPLPCYWEGMHIFPCPPPEDGNIIHHLKQWHLCLPGLPGGAYLPASQNTLSS
jgi:hypothetical protein